MEHSSSFRAGQWLVPSSFRAGQWLYRNRNQQSIKDASSRQSRHARTHTHRRARLRKTFSILAVITHYMCVGVLSRGLVRDWSTDKLDYTFGDVSNHVSVVVTSPESQCIAGQLRGNMCRLRRFMSTQFC